MTAFAERRAPRWTGQVGGDMKQQDVTPARDHPADQPGVSRRRPAVHRPRVPQHRLPHRPRRAARGGPRAAGDRRAAGPLRGDADGRCQRLRPVHRGRPGDPGRASRASAGEYLHAMYLDNFPATASGREVSAYPKTIGSPAPVRRARRARRHPRLRQRCGSRPRPWATSTTSWTRARPSAQITVPTFMLKLVPGYDGCPAVARTGPHQITDVGRQGGLDRPRPAAAVPARAGPAGRPAGAARSSRPATSSPT